ncbi:Rhodanese domain-containing protein [Marinicrinis lubricantis]
MNKKVLIVGGVAGGASAAARLRRLDENVEIIMFERDDYISFANCGLPYYIGETIQERSRLLVQTPEAMKERFNIDVRIRSEVVAVNGEKKTVTVRNQEQGIYEESFDELILSPGAKPIKPPIPGIDSNIIFTLRNIPDTDRIKSYIDQHEIKKAIIIGGGFIGIEMAENMIHRGIDVTVIEAAPHILAPFDSDMVTYAEKELQDQGARLALGDGVESFQEDGKGIAVRLQSGNEFYADMVILAIGVQPDTVFLRDSGIQLGSRGHIIVNEKMQTNLPGIYAVGDAVEITHFIHGQKAAIPLAGPANKQGRIAADNIGGVESVYKGTQGTSIIKIFGLTGAATGLNERALQQSNQSYRVVHVHPASHATYYPGATPIALKLIFNDERRILGAQAFGQDGVDKRMDVIATVIRLNGTIDDLAELELSYAPPFSSAKDPVNMAGYVAQNILSHKVDVFLPKDLQNWDKEKIQLIDVRTENEHSKGAIPSSVNIPVDQLRERLNEIDTSKETWVYCQVGLRGYTLLPEFLPKGATVLKT